MNPLTAEWVAKAESDWDAAGVLYRARNKPNPEAACFHTQQCAEKYLKARLEEAGIPFPQTHSLVALLTLVLPVEPSWAVLEPDLRALAAYAVAVRYPGRTATRDDAKQAIRACRNIRAHARIALEISP